MYIRFNNLPDKEKILSCVWSMTSSMGFYQNSIHGDLCVHKNTGEIHTLVQIWIQYKYVA